MGSSQGQCRWVGRGRHRGSGGGLRGSQGQYASTAPVMCAPTALTRAGGWRGVTEAVREDASGSHGQSSDGSGSQWQCEWVFGVHRGSTGGRKGGHRSLTALPYTIYNIPLSNAKTQQLNSKLPHTYKPIQRLLSPPISLCLTKDNIRLGPCGGHGQQLLPSQKELRLRA